MDHKQSFQHWKPFTGKLHNVLVFYMIAISLAIISISTLCFYNLSFSLQDIMFPVTTRFKAMLPPPSIPLQLQSSQELLVTPPPPLPSPPPPPPPPPSPPYEVIISSLSLNKKSNSLMHNMTDQELFLAASMVQGIDDFTNNKTTSKVAFMFLIKGKLPMAPLWEKFFQGHEGLYSIYLHQDPSYKDIFRKGSAFYGRKIPSQPVVWGTSSMIDAERRLLANALLDFSNQHFVLLSESCIPLFGFKTIHSYLINSSLSHLHSFYDTTKDMRGRYNPQMSPTINITNWRKGSQWFELHRDIAINIVSDTKYYPIFKKYCLPRCYSDEHYIPTLVHMMFPESNSNRSITWVDWSIRGPHPRRYARDDITDDLMNHLRFGSTCVYNGNNTNICFLFGRKFHPSSLEPLLRVSPPLLADYYP